MGKYSYRTLLLKAKAFYFSLRIVYCPALGNVRIHFNSIGFTHIIRKGKDIRPIEDQLRRFRMLVYIPQVIKYGKFDKYRIIEKETVVKRNKIKIKLKTKIHFWTVSHNMKNANMKVVVIQKGNGQKNFLSIM